jgi:DNA-binding MarR family transcriptional regulator
MQRPARRAAPARTSAAPTAGDATLARDAEAVHRVLSELLRLLQFRDRDRICCHDISVTQCYALEALVTGGGQTLNEIAATLLLDKSTASRVLDALVAKGYATRQPHPDDGRAVLLAATPAGKRLYTRIDADLLGSVQAVLTDVDPEVRGAIAGLLEQLLQAAAPRLRGGAEACCNP